MDADLEYARLQASITAQAAHEQDLLAIINKREKQLERELLNVRNVFIEQRQQKRSLLEGLARTAVKELDIARRQYREQIDGAHDGILKKAHEEQSDLHGKYMRRYQKAMEAGSKRAQLPNGAAAAAHAAAHAGAEMGPAIDSGEESTARDQSSAGAANWKVLPSSLPPS